MAETYRDIDRLVAQELSVDDNISAAQKRDINGQTEERAVTGNIYQTIHIHSKTDSIIELARRFEESQREAAMAW